MDRRPSTEDPGHAASSLGRSSGAVWVTPATSGKPFAAVLLLAVLLGTPGGHRFYVSKIGARILMLLTLVGFEIWALIDIIMIALGRFPDSAGIRIRPCPSRRRTRRSSVGGQPRASSSDGGALRRLRSRHRYS